MPRFYVTAGAIRMVIFSFILVALKVNAQAASDASDADILKELAPELGSARLLTMQDLTRTEIDIIGNTPGIGRRFESDFNADGRPDLALFGAYEGGTFVLVASKDQGLWHRAGLIQFRDSFIVGRGDQGAVMVFFCVGCDSGGRVVWNRTRYEFVRFPTFGVPVPE